jgi:hypothetical protein
MMFEETNRPSGGFIELWKDGTGEAGVMGTRVSTEDAGPQRILLPRGSAETRFAPRQYYYLASKTGVVPSWAIMARDQASSRGRSEVMSRGGRQLTT